jgi:hypothetical protein
MGAPLSVTPHVPYAANEQQFLLQAVEAAVKAFRRLSGNPGNDFGDVPSTSHEQDIAVKPRFLEAILPRAIEFDS